MILPWEPRTFHIQFSAHMMRIENTLWILITFTIRLFLTLATFCWLALSKESLCHHQKTLCRVPCQVLIHFSILCFVFKSRLRLFVSLCVILHHHAPGEDLYNFFENIKESRLLSTVHLNQYETAPNFIQSSQNLTSDCLLIWLKTKQFHAHIMQELVKTGKFS